MNISKLHYITNGSSEMEILDEVNAVADAGVDWVQLRIKDDQLDFFGIAQKVKEICENRAVFLINDKVEIAKKVDADGVHLGLEDMPIADARKILGPNKIIGGTANTKDDCLMHQKNGADYIGLGPFRKTTTKKKLSPILGLGGFETILPNEKSEVIIPVVAIGGIGLDDIAPLRTETGIHGIAVSGLIANSERKKELVDSIMQQLDGKEMKPVFS